MYPIRAFKPIAAGTVSVNFGTTTANVSVVNVASEYRLFNDSSLAVFVNFGSSTVTAGSTTAMPLAAREPSIFRPSVPSYTHVAVIATTTGTLYVTPGEGGL
jgi:hypothetical protein